LRTQVTQLPSSETPPPSLPVSGIRFTDNDTLLFSSTADADGRHPEGGLFRVRTDGSGLEALPMPAILPGSRVVPRFQVTGPRTDVLNLELPNTPPANPVPFFAPFTKEAFLLDRDKLLELTNFSRADTFGLFVGADGRRVFLNASVNYRGRNSTESCQLFSIDRLGRDLRQITDLNRGGSHSTTGCAIGSRDCYIGPTTQDPVTGAILFVVACDPFGTSPDGGQVLRCGRTALAFASSPTREA